MRQICIITLAILCAFVNALYGQYKIVGVITDTATAMPAVMASVVAFKLPDTVIASHTRTIAEGKFTLSVPQPGKYLIAVRYTGYGEYNDTVAVGSTPVNLGTINLISKQHLLKEYVFKRQLAAIKIKGDTTEYVADSFKTKANATVEDLLKKLPGIQVDKNGNITAQGESVQKILVDGEEFFSDDPKVVTQGLQANAVDKVQVFDKKSDQAQFTGIDDGEKTKTINIQLKEDKKKGYFGKVDAGAGTHGYFQNQAMLNAFRGKRQLSLFGIASNTDKVGLGWSDNDKFSGGNNFEETDEGYWIMDTQNDFTGWDGKYSGEGLPKVWTAGAHFANKWHQEKYHFAGNYRAARQIVELDGQKTSQYLLPNDKGFKQIQFKNQKSDALRNAFDFVYEINIDTNTSLKITGNAGTKSMTTYSYFNTTTTTPGDNLININNRNINSSSPAFYADASALFKKKFAKKRRTLSVSLKENYKDNSSEGYLHSIKLQPKDTSGQTPGIDTSRIDQLKNTANTSLSVVSKVIYTEPIGKNYIFEGSYQIAVNNSNAITGSFDSTGPGKYDNKNTQYSSDYQFNTTTHRGGMALKYNVKKITFSAGSDLAWQQFIQNNRQDTIGNAKRKYLNVFPSARFEYSFNKQKSFWFTYRGSNRQPTIDQIQPLQQNIDPLNQTLGNPKLKQEFTNSFGLGFRLYKVLTGSNFYVNLNYSPTADAISTKQTNTNIGNYTQYINVKGNNSMYAYMGGGSKIRNSGWSVYSSLSAQLSTTHNIINDTSNTNYNNSYAANLYINYEIEDKLTVSLEPGITYNDNKASITKFVNSYKQYNSELSVEFHATKKLEISTQVNAMFREKTEVFDKNNNVVRWNARASYKFLKHNNLVLNLNVYDILNQNLGYSRSSQAGLITENVYNTIRRYGMLSLQWNFNSNKAALDKDDE
ncbi:MAG: TonB-dependent receptor [Chitinophagia bacterium]|nr:TonB-dependent receptor [Chitinophagia bacterium]